MNSKHNTTSRNWMWMLPVLAIAAGTGVGAATAYSSYRDPVLNLPGHEIAANAPTATVEDAKPRVSMLSPMDFDFGLMARNESQSHTFQLENIGGGPLTLNVLDTTCKCTVGSLAKDSIAPGETAEVTLTWEAKSYDREFRQSATIETNDKNQRELIFSVHGEVTQLAMPDLPLVKFSRISRSEPKQFSTTVYAYRDKDLVITDHHFSNEDVAEFFSISTETLPKSEWNDKNATAAIKVTVDIKPGLPLGVVRQIVALKTNKEDIAPMDVAIEISVVSDISVIGSRTVFDDEKNALMLGPVSTATETKTKLFLLVKGVYKDDVQFSVASIDPAEALDATIGEPIPVKDFDDDGNEVIVSWNFPLTVTVKKDSPTMQRMGSKQGPLGKIVFDTLHPEIPQFDIKVQFATY